MTPLTQRHAPPTSSPRQVTFQRSFLSYMPAIFNIVRAVVYGLVIVWTVICLAMAAHFQVMLASTDLTRFVPFAIFVCAVTLLVLFVLLGFGLRKQSNPISTRYELGAIAMIAIFWLSLGSYIATSASADADVECYYADDPTATPIDISGFDTDTFHAQYHVLEAFSLFNIILLWCFLIYLLSLVLIRHFRGERDIWYVPVTMLPWYTQHDQGKLPKPITSRRGRSRSKSQSRGGNIAYTDKPSLGRVYSSRHPERPARAHTIGGRDRKDKYHRGASPRR